MMKAQMMAGNTRKDWLKWLEVKCQPETIKFWMRWFLDVQHRQLCVIMHMTQMNLYDLERKKMIPSQSKNSMENLCDHVCNTWIYVMAEQTNKKNTILSGNYEQRHKCQNLVQIQYTWFSEKERYPLPDSSNLTKRRCSSYQQV